MCERKNFVQKLRLLAGKFKINCTAFPLTIFFDKTIRSRTENFFRQKLIHHITQNSETIAEFSKQKSPCKKS